MVELENILTLDFDLTDLDSAIDECRGNDLFSDVEFMLDDLKDKITEAATDGLSNAADDVVDLERMFITINRSIVTGGLIESITVDEVSEVSFSILPEADYAEFVEGGRGDVYPVTAKVLHWVDYGEDIFRYHSGPAKPRPFVEPAFERANGGRALMFVEEAIKNVL